MAPVENKASEPVGSHFGSDANRRMMMAAVALVVAAVVLWLFADLLLLVFAAVLVAIVLRSLARLAERYTPLGARGALAIAVLVIGLVLGGFVTLVGTQIQAQAAELIDQLPELWDSLQQRFGLAGIGEWLAEQARLATDEGGLLTSVAGISQGALGLLANIILVLVAGIYLAVRPDIYRRGLLLLVPPRYRPNAAETFDDVGRALELWLHGQLVAMLMVGSLTTLGLWLLGVPSALALGVLAGLAEFVPLIGPIVAAVPAILVALSESGTLALWVIGLYILIQQVEGNVIMPLIQRRMVDLPPAITLFAIVAFWLLFGAVGVLLATPLAVLVFVLVKKLWVRDTLDEKVDMPGEH